MAGGIKEKQFPAAVLDGFQQQRCFRLNAFLCSGGVGLRELKRGRSLKEVNETPESCTGPGIGIKAAGHVNTTD